jgi:hypothetical protein
MAESTAGMIVLRNRETGNTRAESFTMTPTDKEFATFTSTGTTFLLTAPGGEDVVDLQFNNDGETTVTKCKFYSDGADIRNTYLMVLFAADSKMPNRMVSRIGYGGNKQLQIQFLA